MSNGRLCSRCAHPLPAKARFCSNCGYPSDPPSASDEQRHRRLTSSAPSDIARKMRTSVLKGERRPITAVFADVVGSTAILERVDPEDWTNLLNEAFDLMTQAVYRYEGTIAHLLGDGLLAFFGSPIAHEDDPERAVRAAIDMLDLLNPFSARLASEVRVDFRIRIGVNTGAVIVGDLGSDLRYEYTAIGDAINVAARLQGEAEPGTILVAAPTYRFIAPKFETRYVGPLALRGRADPVVAYQVLELKAVPEPTRGLPGLTSTLIGRAQPLGELEDLLKTVTASRQGAAVLVLGEPGIGKSRLLQELRLRVEHPDTVAWAQGRCLSFGRAMPYHLLLDLLRSLLAVSATPSVHDAGTALASGLEGMDAGTRSDVRTYLARLLGLPLSEPEAEEIHRLSEEARHERLLASLAIFLSHVATRMSHVLVCEDVHWADRSSIDVLEGLLQQVAQLPLLLVLTSRPEPDAPVDELAEAAARAFRGSFRTIRLGPLSETENRDLVAQLLEIESLPIATRELILRKSEGNPLFVEEIIRMLMEQGAIIRSGNRWVSNRNASMEQLPTTLQGLLLARVDRLPEDAKRLARVGAVIGRQFDLPAATEVLNRTDGHIDVEHSVEVLESFGLVESLDTRYGRYSFRHALIEEAVYESILQRDRSHLHGAVAEALERIHASQLDDSAAVLAFHFERAGNVDRSISYLMRAGQNALQRFAPQEAYDLFGRALRYLSSSSDGLETLRKRVRAGLGRAAAGGTFVPGHEQVAELEALLQDAEEVGELSLLAEVHLALAEARHELGEIPAVSPALARSIETVERISKSLDDDRLRALPVALRGFSHYAASEYRQAVSELREAVPLLERHFSLTKAAYYSGMLAISAARLGEFALADEWIEKADSLARRSQDPTALMDVDLHRGIVEGERGDIAKSLEFAKRGTQVAERIDNKACALVGYFVMGDQQLRMGLAEEARISLERSTAIAEFCNVADIENLSRAWLSAVRARLGEEKGVLPRLDESLAKAREMGDRLSEGEIRRQRAIVLAKMPEADWDAVTADFESAIAIFRQIEARPYIARALRDYGITLQASHKIGEGRKKLQEALELFRSMQMHFEDRPPAEDTELTSGKDGTNL